MSPQFLGTTCQPPWRYAPPPITRAPPEGGRIGTPIGNRAPRGGTWAPNPTRHLLTSANCLPGYGVGAAHAAPSPTGPAPTGRPGRPRTPRQAPLLQQEPQTTKSPTPYPTQKDRSGLIPSRGLLRRLRAHNVSRLQGRPLPLLKIAQPSSHGFLARIPAIARIR